MLSFLGVSRRLHSDVDDELVLVRRTEIEDLKLQVAELKESLIAAHQTRNHHKHQQWNQAQCNANSDKVLNEQKRWNTFCKAMGFPLRGNPYQPKCVTIQAQSPLTAESSTCYAKHGVHCSRDCLGPLGQLIGTWEGEFGKSYTAVPKYGFSNGVNNGQSNDTEWHGWADIALQSGLAMIPGKPTAGFHPMKQQTYKVIHRLKSK